MSNPLSIGLFGLHRGSSAEPGALARRARLAEEAGFESLWVGDHIALPVGDAQLHGMAAEEARLEAIVGLTYVAALTSRVKLGIGVIVLPQRQPVLLAKQLATLDVLSNGRLIVGIGVGYVEPELQALGASLADRGARTDEYLAAMRALWAEPPPSFSGRFVAFQGVLQRPRPRQQPYPPIVVGGQSASAYRRTIQSANGWYGFNLDLEQTAAALAELRAAASRYERPAELGELEITVTPRGELTLDTARQYADLGVHRLAIQPHTMQGSAMDELIARLASEVIPRL
jgi:probable F420-dependent oxidoreductase